MSIAKRMQNEKYFIQPRYDNNTSFELDLALLKVELFRKSQILPGTLI